MSRTPLMAALLALAIAAPCAAAPAAKLDANDAKAREIFAKLISYKTSVGLGQVPAMVDYPNHLARGIMN